MEYVDFLARIVAALLLSFAVGLERQWRRRAIGLRTNVLVCIGAFLFVAVSVMLGSNDLKIAAQVVSGIGFLGAGVILKDGLNIRGLNTAATLWCSAALGVLCAYGLIIEAVTGTFFILVANILLRYITRKLMKHNMAHLKDYVIEVVTSKDKELILRTTLIQSISDEAISISGLETRECENSRVEIKLYVSMDNKNEESLKHLITRFTMEPEVFYVGYKFDNNKNHHFFDDDES